MSLHWSLIIFFLLSRRPRSSTSSKSSNPVQPSCGHPWWTQPSTCFSSKWRLNWNRLKTNGSRPKMNWVPGNLHLIGKDNQNNIPTPPKKVKTSSRPPPSLSLQACRNNGGGEGWQKLLLTTRLRLYKKSQSLQKNRHVFVLLHCGSHTSRKLNWNWKQYGQVTLVFQLSPLVSPHRPRAWRSPDCSWRGGHSLPETDTPSPPRQLKPDSSHIK